MAKARSRWPVEGSIEGEPTVAHFEHGPLAAAREYFSRYFDQALMEVEGSPVRYYMTVSTFFPCWAFSRFGLLTTSRSSTSSKTTAIGTRSEMTRTTDLQSVQVPRQPHRCHHRMGETGPL